MNKKRTKLDGRRPLACAAVLGLVATCAWGGLSAPLYVGNTNPVLDQYGRPMLGSHQISGGGNPSRVEIRTTTDGIARPPYPNGAAHYKNPLLTADSIGGMGLNAGEPNSGMFCMVYSDRSVLGTSVFVRVFNAPTLAEASFYADSWLVPLSKTNVSSLVVNFKAAQPMDTGDDDNDGLINSWEKALGIDDRLTGDYDGDGMGDLDEMLAGTAPDDPTSLLTFRLVRREAAVQPLGEGGTAAPRPVRVRWQSVPGKTYRLEYVPMLTAIDPATGQPHAFELVPGGLVVAGADEYEIDMEVDVSTNATGVFRVKLVRE